MASTNNTTAGIISNNTPHQQAAGVGAGAGAGAAAAAAVVRPTEAQLRWAQFSHRSRAAQVRASAEALWQTPLNPGDVPGALSDDGNTTASSGGGGGSAAASGGDGSDAQASAAALVKVIRKRRPKISRGRRALLRVSERALEKRRERIRQHGFRGSVDDLLSGEMDGEYGYHDGSDSENSGDEDDALAAIFADESFIKRQKRRRRRQRHNYFRRSSNNSSGERERVERFEAAFHSMMMRMASAQQTAMSPVVATPTKIWTRPEGYEDTPFNNMDYSELKWGMVSTKKKAVGGNPNNVDYTPLDRGASWLVHLPSTSMGTAKKQPQYYPYYNEHHDAFHSSSAAFSPMIEGLQQEEGDGDGRSHGKSACVVEGEGTTTTIMPTRTGSSVPGYPSPMRRTFSSIVDRLQQQLAGEFDDEASAEDFLISADATPTPKTTHLSKFFRPAQLDDAHQSSDVVREEKKEDPSSPAGGYHRPRHGGGTGVSPIASRELDTVLADPDRVSPATDNPGSTATPRLLRAFLDPEEEYDDYDEEGQIAEENFTTPRRRGPASNILSATPKIRGGGAVINNRQRSEELEAALAYESPYPILHQRLSSLRKPGRRTSLFMDSVLEEMQQKDQDASILNELECENPGLSKKLFTLYLEETDYDPRNPEEARQRLIEAARDQLEQYAQRYKWEQTAATPPVRRVQRTSHKSFVSRLVAQLEEAVSKGDQEALVSADGKLHKATFARLVRRYLVDTRPEKSLGSNKSRVGASIQTGADSSARRGRVADRYLSGVRGETSGSSREGDGGELAPPSRDAVGSLVELFLAKVEQSSDEEMSEIIDAEGNLNGPIFEQMVSRYLAEATGFSEEQVLAASDLESLGQGSPKHSDNRGTEPAAPAQGDQQPSTAPVKVDPNFVKSFVVQVQRASEVEQLFLPDGTLVKPAFERILLRCVQQDAPKSDRAFDLGVRSPLVLARARQSVRGPSRFGQESLDNSGPPILESPTVVRRFLRCMEEESEKEKKNIRKPNGKLDAAVFETLVDRCLTEAISSKQNKEQEQSLEKRRATALDESLSLFAVGTADDFVRNFVDRCVNVSRQRLFVDGGKLVDKGELHSVISSCLELQQHATTDKERNLEPFVDRFVNLVEEECMLGSFRGAVLGEDHILLEDLAKHWTDEAALEYHRAMRKSSESLVSSSLPTASSSLTHDTSDRNFASVASDHASTNSLDTNVDEARITSYDGSAAGVLANKLAGSVSGKFGGFMKRFYGGDDTREPGEEELQAVAAFRRTQDTRRSADDSSSLSSFRSLPDGIKQVVQNFRRGQLPTNEEDADDTLTEISSVQPEGSFVGSLDGLSSFSLSQSNHASEYSPERLKIFHHKVMEKSALIGDGDQNRSIIDTDGSEASHQAMDAGMVSNLLLSPTILTKRHQQAIRAIEKRNWEQVEYLMSANPWLAEMSDLKTNQYLLHKLSLFGAGDGKQQPSSDKINTDLVRMFPASVHKFDHDGNLPLHMAAAAANLSMIGLLGDRFPSGASVRNEDGMLPLHLVILAIASPQARRRNTELGVTSVSIVEKTLDYFKGAVAVADNEGNLPIHTAVAAVKGDDCVDVVNLLLNEAERQVKDPTGARFQNKIKTEGSEVSFETTDTLVDDDDVMHCNLVQNDRGETPLMTAINSRAGWKVIDRLLAGPGGHKAPLYQDHQRNNALHHLLVSEEFRDPASVMCILKAAPEAASIRNEDNILPIELACRHGLPREVILALVLVDLPFDLECEALREGFGASWFFLACECDDHYVDIVEEVVSLCSYPQARELCFFDNGSGDTLLGRATPRCRSVLQRALRFVGRFEFMGSIDSVGSQDEGLEFYRLFNAIDFGTRDAPFPEGKPVVLKCYISEDLYEKETRLLREVDLDTSLLEEVTIFGVGEDGMPASDGAKQHCISIEQPNLTLNGVVEGMLKNEDCQTLPAVRKRYGEKVFAVLRVVAKSLRYLHSIGIVHGGVCTSSCGKYESKWKVSRVLGSCRAGDLVDERSLTICSPPESVDGDYGSFKESFKAHPSLDTWAFGKLSFEVLVGEPLFPPRSSTSTDDDVAGKRNETLTHISLWNDYNLQEVRRRLAKAFVSEAGIDLILECLSPQPERRPTMAEVLSCPFWNEIRRPGKIGSRKNVAGDK